MPFTGSTCGSHFGGGDPFDPEEDIFLSPFCPEAELDPLDEAEGGEDMMAGDAGDQSQGMRWTRKSRFSKVFLSLRANSSSLREGTNFLLLN
jgi:hypothetical protein